MASAGYGVDVRKRRRIAKERAFVPLLGSDYGATLNTTLKEPKNSPFYLLKISPLIRTAPKCIERAGDSKEESPISSLVGSDYGATLNTTLKEPKNSPFYLLKISPLIRTAPPWLCSGIEHCI